ncbi:helix-turn-helix domain-containing protein [Flavobacterium sp.]|uniref:helix-turn-helix domain-containing protein n=1 Tax=Flavobacterium sp. TaxID=239 RepID=UPI002B4B87D1|nr:helix-turn-helix domain-containing protein [Flavobacterium sp.]HLP64307.1 helix-turn-helix domain-containing protein [Flavobacterium sp.]
MEITKSIFNFFMIAGVIQGFLFIFITSFGKRSREKSLVFLNLVVLFLSLNNLQIALIDNVFTASNFFVRNLLIPFYVLIVPSFYLFLIHYLKIEKKITSFFYWTIVLFSLEILARLLLLPHYYNQDKNSIIARYAQIEEIVNAVYSLFIFAKAIELLFKRSHLYQNILRYDDMKWLKNFSFFGSLLLLLWVLAIVLNLDAFLNPKIVIYYPLRLFSSFLLYWIGYQGFFRYYLTSERIEIRSVIEQASSKNKQVKSFEENTKKIEKFNQIENYITESDCYLDPNLSLKSLSEELNISVSLLSQIINQGSQYNFSDYINQFRVNKAKEFLKDKSFENYTIESIGLECGFNSKSTFYAAFKKFTSLTPIAFRNQ